MSSPVRILLADDHGIVREGLRAILDSRPDFTIVGEAATGREALSLAQRTTPDVVVMDINMPDLNGIEATRQIIKRCPRVKIICLSVHLQAQYVSEVLRAGAVGYVPKKSAAQELISAIATALKGKTHISPDVAGQLVETHVRHLPGFEPTAFSQLSGREREVLQLLAEGNATKEIAGLLSLSVPTVHTHRQNIMQKLGLHSIAELTKYAVREGLTELEE